VHTKNKDKQAGGGKGQISEAIAPDIKLNERPT
jgi:hypothetical protein